MKVFVTGATGYIGGAVAAALARAGHEVYGLARSEAKARHLAAAEVVPVDGSMEDPESYRAAVTECDVVIHAAVEYSDRGTRLDRQTIEAMVGMTVPDRPSLLIYTSGAWIYGPTGDRVADEAGPIAPARQVAWRPEHERLVLAAATPSRRTIVLRPGCVYGGPGGLTASWFASALHEGAARIVGDGRNRWAMVHQQDLADAYVRAAESSLSGEVFNIADGSRFTVLECAGAASRAAGAAGKVITTPVDEASRTMGGVAECLAMDQALDASKAERLLGWRPRHTGFPAGAARYFLSCKAAAAE